MNEHERVLARCVVTLGKISSELQDKLTTLTDRRGYQYVQLSTESDLSNFLMQEISAIIFCDFADLKEPSESQLCDCRTTPFARLLLCETATIPFAVTAMQLGYFTVMDRLPSDEDFAALVSAAFEQTEMELRDAERKRRMLETLDRMTEGELLVLRSVVDGHLNKRIAKRLEISERTVEARRKRIFEKTETTSVAMLVRSIVESIGIDELYQRCEEKTDQPPSPHLRFTEPPSGSQHLPPRHNRST